MQTTSLSISICEPINLIERSSISNTASSYLHFPKIPVDFIKEVAIPVCVFDPSLFVITSVPRVANISEIRFVAVVLPLVPVTPIIVFGFFAYLKKPGHILNATIPGKSVPLYPNTFRAIIASFATQSATKYLILFIKSLAIQGIQNLDLFLSPRNS